MKMVSNAAIATHIVILGQCGDWQCSG